MCEQQHYADTKVREEERGGGAANTRAEVSLLPMVQTMVRQDVTLKPLEVSSGADAPAARVGPHASAGGCVQKRLSPCGKPTLGQVCWQDP